MPDKALLSRLKSDIFECRDEAVKLLSRLVSIPSISGDEGEIQRELYQLFLNLDGKTTRVPMKESLRRDPKFASGNNTSFAGRPQTRFLWHGLGNGKSLILCAHSDVVEPGDWKDAFKPRVEGDFLYGRGSVDDKCSIVSIYLALKAIQKMDLNLAGDVEVHLTNEEEVGMAGALAFVREGFKADGVLILEPTDHKIFDAHRGCLQFKIEVEGKQAHLGKKRYGVSAIEKAAKIIDALVKYEDILIEEGRGYPRFESYKYPGQVNIGIINGGSFFSIVPDAVSMEGGVGFLPIKTIADIESDLKKIICEIKDDWIKDHTEIHFNGLKNEPYQMPEKHPFTLALQKTLKSMGREVEVLGMMATCDARYYYNQGNMPSIVYGGLNNGQAHSKHEHACISDILETAIEYAGFIIDWCGESK